MRSPTDPTVCYYPDDQECDESHDSPEDHGADVGSLCDR